MTVGLLRRHWPGLTLSLVWITAVVVVVDHQRVAEIGRLVRECHQIQDDARAAPACAAADSAGQDTLCRYKDADCDQWPREEMAYLRKLAAVALLPVVLGWLAVLAVSRRRSRPTGGVGENP